MLPSVSTSHSATRNRPSASPVAISTTMGTNRKGVNCMPEVSTDALKKHILQQLANASRPLTALELAQSFGTYEIRSRVNSVLYRELTLTRLVEQVPDATGSKPGWRLKAPVVAESALNAASSTGATGVGTTSSVVQHHHPCEPSSTYSRDTSTAAMTAGQPVRHSSVSLTSAEPVGTTPSRASLPGSSSRMVVGAAACNIRTAPVNRMAAAEPISSNYSSHPWNSVEALIAAFGHIWNEPAATISDSLTLQQNPIEYKQRFQDAFYSRVHPARQELQAAMDSIHDIAQRLQQRASSQYALQLNNQPVSIDRVCIAGSVGKGTCVSGSFDVDIVLFVNLPPAYRQSVNTMDPDSTHNDDRMKSLYEQLHRCLQADLPQLVDVKRGNSAVSCQLVARGDCHRYPPMYVSVDLLLAPNLAGAGQNIADECKAAAQRAAVLQPLLAVGDAWSQTPHTRRSAGNTANTSAQREQSPMIPRTSYARAIWLQESTTQYVRAAAATLEELSGGSSSKVVTNTMTLTKAWIRKGLQQGERVADYKHLKGFMVELLVLKAAHRWCQLLQEQQQRSPSTSNCGAAIGGTGRHMLDLFLLVLQEAQRWADIAEDSKCVSLTSGNLRPILYTDVPCKDGNGQQVAYYTDQQAWGLQKAAVSRGEGWTRGEQCFAQPVVVHPVDPLDNIFSQRRVTLPMWHRFKADAATLHKELCEQSWGHILSKSSLAAVLGHVSHV